MLLFSDPYFFQEISGGLPCFFKRHAAYLRRSEDDVVYYSHVREEVEPLEDHAHLAPHLIYVNVRVSDAPVSYTHLDVYKRQMGERVFIARETSPQSFN